MCECVVSFALLDTTPATSASSTYSRAREMRRPGDPPGRHTYDLVRNSGSVLSCMDVVRLPGDGPVGDDAGDGVDGVGEQFAAAGEALQAPPPLVFGDGVFDRNPLR